MVWPRDDKEMIRIPTGEFLYGTNNKPFQLPGFWIDKAPVTNAEYAHFVNDTSREPPKHWRGKEPSKEIVDHPVTSVSWHAAKAYCEWAGKRLPTEQEWEKAARGIDGRIYPWGNEEPSAKLCNFDNNEGDTTPVGKYSPQGDSPYGCMDMAGNIWEWTSTSYNSGDKVLRGGAWANVSATVRSTNRSNYNASYSRIYNGFRCARDAD
jgi:formylglycine-generating enzyme required for sulfatase activity